MTIIVIAVLVALFSSGCVSEKAMQAMMDEKIAANNAVFVQPMLRQQSMQISAVQAEVAKSSAQVGTHQEVLVDYYTQQQQQASAALSVLNPAPVLFSAPVTAAAPSNAVPADSE